MSDLQELMLQRMNAARNELQRLLDTGLEPRELSDPDKLRLQAALLDKQDFDRGVFDRTEVQEDLRRIADYIETAALTPAGDDE